MKIYKNGKLPVLSILAVLAAAVPGFCGQESAGRVISLSPLITEILYLVDAGDCLIGNTTYCEVPEAAKLKDKIGSVTQVNIEKIIRLQPDRVIAGPLSREKQLKALENHGIRVMRTGTPKTLEQICDLTRLIGDTVGRRERAREIVRGAQKEAAAILEWTRTLEKPRVFVQIGLKPLHSANRDSFIHEYIRYAGGINIAENEASGIYSREKVLERDPEIILIAVMGTSENSAGPEKESWMGFKGISAVKAGRVHVLDPDMICSPTPVTFVRGLKTLLPLIQGPDALEAFRRSSAGEGA